MIKAKSKNINITIILLLLSLLCGISDVRAEYSVSKIEKITGNIKYNNENYGNGYKFTLEDKNTKTKTTAYCIDPGGDAPNEGANVTYNEVKSVDPSLKNQLDYACANAKSGSDFSTAARSIAVSTAKNIITPTSDVKNAYDKIYKGELGSDDVKELVKGASGSKGKGTPSISVKDVKNSKSTIITINKNGTLGKVDIAGEGITCNKEETENTITLTCRKACKGSFDESIGSVSYSYGDSGKAGGVGKSPSGGASESGTPKCTTKYYKSSSAGKIQFLAACFCDKQSDESNNFQNTSDSELPLTDVISEIFTVSCDGKEDDECYPAIPDLILSELENGGTEICNENGDTVIKIDEWYKKDSSNDWALPSFDEFICQNNKGNADINGESVKATGHFLKDKTDYNKFKDFCSISCAEDFEMVLPGPDGKDKFDESVMVNSGTFFTIKDEKMKSVSTLKCYERLNDDKFKNYMKKQREDSKNLYNDYVKTIIYDTLKGKSCSSYPHTVKDESNCWTTEEGTQECANKTVYGAQTSPFSAPGYANYNFATDHLSKGISQLIQIDTGANYDSSDVAIEACNTAKERYKPEKTCDDSCLSSGNADFKKNMDDAAKYWTNVCLDWHIEDFKHNPCPGNSLKFEWYDGYILGLNVDITTENSVSKETGGLQKYTSDGTKTNKYNSIGYYTSLCGKDECGDKGKTSVNSIYLQANALEITTNYKFQNNFCIGNDGSITDDAPENCSGYSIEGFPVSYETIGGKYYYQYDYSNIGYYLDENGTTNRCGRLSNSILGGYYGGLSSQNTCYYNVNRCTRCDVGCESRDCDIGQKTCDRLCKVACVGGGCILDANAGFLATYRTISLNNFLAGRTNQIISAPDITMLLAYNDSSLISVLGDEDASKKASSRKKASSTITFPESNWDTEFFPKVKETKAEIDSNGEGIYDNDPEYRFKLTPGNITKIKEYNKGKLYNSMDTSGYKFENGYYRYTSPFLEKFGVQKNSKFKSWGGYEENEPFLGPAWK